MTYKPNQNYIGVVFQALYNTSLGRSQRDKISLSVAFGRTLLDFYHNGLEALCVTAPLNEDYAPPLVYQRHGGPRGTRGDKNRKFVRAGARTNPNHRGGRGKKKKN